MRILIIGGTSGIGYYVGKCLEKRGHKVIIGPTLKVSAINQRKKQRAIFSLIEKKNYKSLSKTIIKLIESNKKKAVIKKPIFQALFTKLYDFFMH